MDPLTQKTSSIGVAPCCEGRAPTVDSSEGQDSRPPVGRCSSSKRASCTVKRDQRLGCMDKTEGTEAALHGCVRKKK